MQLAKETAFSPGSDLWIVPERKNSSLTQKIDWYLNFQISKSAHHETPDLPSPLIKLLKDCALENYDWAPKENDSLLVLSVKTLPSRWVMVLRGSDRLDTWVETAVEKWEKLKSPTVRVYLPTGVAASEFEKLWKKSGGDPQKVTTIVDQGSSKNG